MEACLLSEDIVKKVTELLVVLVEEWEGLDPVVFEDE
jgi:hypothetical protein